MSKKGVKKKVEGIAFSSPVSSAQESQESSFRERALNGLLYTERVRSFKSSWPFKKKTDQCSVHNLAMAGFSCLSSSPLKVRCVVCYKTLSDLKRTSNAWDLHKEVSPDCAIVKFGYPTEPDSYTIAELYQMMLDATTNKLEEEFREYDEFNRKALEAVASNHLGTSMFDVSVSSSNENIDSN